MATCANSSVPISKTDEPIRNHRDFIRSKVKKQNHIPSGFL
ncbi:MAG: hypothetical protein OJF59_000246 [Cytophagales bacterium]|jgi:hypothetical protein|nr:MAG: hypothetical protein OJF59_000246 [Cytophagales bacterium]